MEGIFEKLERPHKISNNFISESGFSSQNIISNPFKLRQLNFFKKMGTPTLKAWIIFKNKLLNWLNFLVMVSLRHCILICFFNFNFISSWGLQAWGGAWWMEQAELWFWLKFPDAISCDTYSLADWLISSHQQSLVRERELSRHTRQYFTNYHMISWNVFYITIPA